MTITEPADQAAETEQAAPLPLLHIPYVEDWLREETIEAVEASQLPYALTCIEHGDDYGYARAFERWWQSLDDLMVLEHDMLPAEGLLQELASCPEDWCSANYHVGQGRTTTGLGITKISWRVKAAWPYGGTNIARDPRDTRNYVHWISLNEAVDRHLSRLGYRQHIHFPNPVHLHYDQVSDAAG